MNIKRISLIAVFAFGAGITPANACHDGSPLVLDLNGDGIHTTELSQSVSFDIDGDGSADVISWTNPDTEEGFLYLDLDHNGQVNDGRELFGDATALPSGATAENGFLALAVYDQPDFGGNGDGVISREDHVWKELGVWVDRNHDGVSQHPEMRPAQSFQIEEIALDYEAADRMDGNLNVHKYLGIYQKRSAEPGGAPTLRTYSVHDVFFRIAHVEE